MRSCPAIIPQQIPIDFNIDEAAAVIAFHVPELDGDLEWILDQEINGSCFQRLNHSILNDFGIHKFGIRDRILQLQLSTSLAKLPGKQMLRLFGVNS
jgi:hypothetical protein